jgi:sec-independent protein translocase protein TatC
MSDTENNAQMTFTEHLAELRIRIIRSVIALIIGIAVCLAFSQQILTIIMHPLLPLQEKGLIVQSPEVPGEGETPEAAEVGAEETPEEEGTERADPQVVFLNPIEPFMVYIKLAAYGGIVVSLPFIVYQICAFIFPGLKPRERTAVRIVLVGCSILMVLGVTVAYYGVFPLVFPYLVQYAPSWVAAQYRMNETVDLIIKGLAAFAIVFQFPMAVLALVYLDLLQPASLRRWRKVAVVGIFLISAIFTPPDPFSMLLMAGPLVVLYEGSIWLSYLVVHMRTRERKAASS